MELKNLQISQDQANKLADYLSGKGFPVPGKMLILSSTGEQKTVSGLILASTTDKKELPRKGVLIQNNSEELTYLKVGTIITYGMYAGKELHMEDKLYEMIGVRKEDYTFTVLSESEVVYTESNK